MGYLHLFYLLTYLPLAAQQMTEIANRDTARKVCWIGGRGTQRRMSDG